MTYQELLNSNEWKSKRLEILEIDNFRCQICFNEKILIDSKQGFLEDDRFFVEHDNIDYLNIIVPDSLPKFSGKDTIFYGKYVKSRIYIICARKKTDDERKLEKINKKILDNFKNINSYLKSTNFEIDEKQRIELENKVKETNPNKFDWIIFTGLHVHHKYYIEGRNPWEYSNDALITLCETCHDEKHSGKTIPVYNLEMVQINEYHNCTRCNGKGVFPEYSHVQSGICFKCNGAKYEELIDKTRNANNIYTK
jgi:5-methylcytosine-specific restriction endonuclease McrA